MKQQLHKEQFSLLVKVYNRTIETYFHFPEVILYNSHRLEVEEFDWLLGQGYVEPYYTDSFGKRYRLSAKAETCLFHSLKMKTVRRKKTKKMQHELAKLLHFDF